MTTPGTANLGLTCNQSLEGREAEAKETGKGGQPSTGSPGPSDGEKPQRIDPKQMKFVMYEGMMLPELFDPVQVQLQKVKDFSLRVSDVLLCSYPKSGTHWLWRVLDMLVSGKAEYTDRFPDLTILDMQRLSTLCNLPSPRVLVTHLPFDLLPQQVKDGGVKVVHVYRDPKAVMVSVFCQMENSGKFPDITLDRMEDMIFSEKSLYRNQFYYFDKVNEFERNNPGVNIFHIAYEDMKQDTAGCIKRLAAYLKVDATDELCSQIAQAVSFSTQKEQEGKRSHSEVMNSRFYRKGEVADWKNHLTVAQSERLDQVLKDRAATCTFSRRYC